MKGPRPLPQQKQNNPGITMATDAPKKPAEVVKDYVRTKQGVMIHHFTAVAITTDPKKMEIDSFIQVQVEAGKLILGEAA
jgi:hypothetical protein